MNQLPMSFDWKAAKQRGGIPGLQQTSILQMPNIGMLNYDSDVKNSAELVQSILMHIENQVKRTTDIDGYVQYGRNPYAYVVGKFVMPMLFPMLVNHKIDANGIMYIATTLKQDQSAASFINANGLLEQAREYDDHIEISPQVILKAIVDKCM